MREGYLALLLEEVNKRCRARKSSFTGEQNGYASGSACPITRLMPGN